MLGALQWSWRCPLVLQGDLCRHALFWLYRRISVWCRVASIYGGTSNWADDARVTHSLDYVAFTRPPEALSLLTNFD